MRTPIAIIIGLLLVGIVQAAVTLTPTSIYETTTVTSTINVDNYGGSTIIKKITADSPSINITGAKDYTGWTTSYDADSAEWKDGTIETNTKSALFELDFTVPKVTKNSTATVTVSLDSSATAFNISIINDATPPKVTNITPKKYAKANNPSQKVTAIVTDPETSVATVRYTYNDCTGNDTFFSMTKINNTYSGTAVFTDYDEGETACYTITATNTPGETINVTGTLEFDGTAPSVTLISPTDYATENTTFTFNATDNIATQLTCEVYLRSTLLATLNTTSGTITSTTHDLTNSTEGSATWKVTCEDGVGLTSTSVKSIEVDTKAPTISMNTVILKRTVAKVFSTTITDTIGVANANATFDGTTINLTKNGNNYTGTISSNTTGTKELIITATDNTGHTTTYNQTITTIPNHKLTLTLKPSITSTGDTVTATGTLTADGNKTSTTVELTTPSGTETLNLSGNTYTKKFTAPNTPGTYTITAIYTEAGYDYKVTSTLTVQGTGSSSGDSSSGYSSSYSGGSGYVKPQETTPESGTNALTPDEPITQEIPQEEVTYEPLPPEQPRTAISPQATGIFNLGGPVKWLALLLAVGLIGGLGAYGYSKRPRQKDGMSWDGYFK